MKGRDILVGPLEREAKMHYKTLPKDVRNGNEEKAESRRAGRASQSCEKTPNNTEKEDQSVLQFCLEFKRCRLKRIQMLIITNYRSCGQRFARATEPLDRSNTVPRDNGVRNQWEGSRENETALRMERLRENSSLDKAHRRHWDFRAKAPLQGMNDGKKCGGRAPQRSHKDVHCANCGKRGYEAQDCWSKESDRQACDHGLMVLQIAIIPLEILKRARDRGQDMGRLCTHVPLPDVNAYDASGNKMDLLLNLGIEGSGEHPVRA
ncbi:hypothetical protein COOONC_01365 [Cooperia oncophora]